MLAVKRIRNGRAVGPGDLLVELIKNALTAVLETILKLFNDCINGGDILNEWGFDYLI